MIWKKIIVLLVKRMKTLYISDLDGTLLRKDERTSEFTNETINALVERGLLFSYATARSHHSAPRATQGLTVRLPLIVYNGAMIVDGGTGELLLSNFFGDSADDCLDELIRGGIWPIVYSFVEGTEHFSYLAEKCSGGTLDFVATRKGDPRDNPVGDPRELYLGEKFYITCIDEKEKLEPFFEKYKERFHCVFHRDIYSGEYWLEIMPKEASKSNAVRQLKERLGCGRLVVFGDGRNDIDMFQAADEAYAVENAVEELKKIADGVIGSNQDDGVAKWLLARCGTE